MMTSQLFKTLISVDQLTQYSSTEVLRIFDCRFNLMDVDQGFMQFQQGHIPNSQYADLNKQQAAPVANDSGRHPLPDKSEFESQLRQWGIGENAQVVVYDDAGGAIAARLWWLCKWAGLDSVAVLDGGIQAWTAAGNPLSTEPAYYPSSQYCAHYDDELWVSTQTVDRLKNETGVVLTDARAKFRFDGKKEPIDIKAGHVPGAKNYPFDQNLSQQGTFLSPSALKQIHQTNDEHTQVISMCGSGVTACHNILARAHAGLGLGQLYVGSWSEWITSPEREIVIESD